MGLFDFFRRRKKRKRGHDVMGSDQTPRLSHYIFAHVALRQFAFNSPYMCVGALGSAEAKRFLGELLEAVEEYCRDEGDVLELEVDQIKPHSRRAGKLACLVIQMPPPRAATEAHLVAIVLKPSSGETAANLPEVQVRYFTLEEGVAQQSGSRTVLCEWTPEGEHLNYGEGPPPDIDKFLKKITEMCSA